LRLTLSIIALALSVTAAAQEAPKASRSTFLRLMDVQELWEEDRYEDAIAMLEALAQENAERPYDFALSQQYLAHTAVMMGEAERARPALEAALAQPGLPADLSSNLKLFYGQIVMGDDEFELARRMFDEWLETTTVEPTAGQLFTVSYANYMSGNLDRAVEFITRAIDGRENPPDNWIRLQYQILFDVGRYDDALAVAVQLVDRDPLSEDYWRLLASHHMRREDYTQALSAFAIAYQNGVLSKEDDLRRIASLYGHVAVPEKAARLLEQWIEEESIEKDAETWRTLGDMWMLARERDNAKVALWNSVEAEPDADTFEFLAGIHFEDAEWEQAHEGFERALGTGDVEEEDVARLQLLAGLTAMRSGDKDTAREYLLLAESDDELRGQVRGLLRELDES
jgi:tetratricopeptide (TPR) repeat protein